MKSTLKFYFFIFKLFLKGNGINSIQKTIEVYKHKTMMLEFRSNALLFGFYIENYTDEEIIKMVNTASNKIAFAGVSGAEAGEAFSRLAKAMVYFEPEFN